MSSQHGFTLLELMIVIAIIAILGAIAVPAYQRYLQKAAMTDVLQAVTPYRTEVELCALEQGSLSACSEAQLGLAAFPPSTYVSTLSVDAGIISLSGQQTLAGLRVTLTPTLDRRAGTLRWQQRCQSEENNAALLEACRSVLRETDDGERP
ncbi:prepilin peptidase-dependent pilin [Edwardsiella piscicida]|uniref:prepilin peptidase-dependent pilin n=1 Tax=Edwardsiella piscicida TaxID=1263550 RepID=UPI00054CBFCD|nr:prepilin peptidase-dependent pilin [Edwardsiella piscicida]EKS7793515.1 prepilin peptidase-dependent pilin [Edwardsiella piscicida]EKS7812531.1 prepilin peptidase-dependent pilin [Edwardsiella piscicida]ELM3657625.1 prepilin peptidase-dependent pilin [Edwardsiella piscicida]ELM3721457.1 prepilin peptidase-dependent pilin [Edwardsiella piscicida]ELM3728249.1 prepilin peptidase-dependent pilin [Edwardsiella piscicida]